MKYLSLVHDRTKEEWKFDFVSVNDIAVHLLQFQVCCYYS